jgi:hypothetical protein
MPRRQILFRPRMSAALKQKNYLGWQQAVKRVL